MKGRQRKERRKGADCVASDGSLPPTGQSGVHRTVWCTVRPALCSWVFLATLAIIHRIVRARRRTVQCTSRAMATCHVDQGPTVIWRTGPFGAPQKRKPSNQVIFCRVLCSYCSLSAMPTDRRQELPTKLIHPAQVGLVEAQQIRVARSPTVH
jgi:hypothetical protein